MTSRELIIGRVVYHRIFTFWGKGKVVATRRTDNLGFKTALRYCIEWPEKPTGDKVFWCRASDLRKTFNQRKADQLAVLKPQRGCIKST